MPLKGSSVIRTSVQTLDSSTCGEKRILKGLPVPPFILAVCPTLVLSEFGVEIQISPRIVMSSSSYSKSPEIKAKNLEVQRVPGNGFSSCAAPTFSRIQGISNGGRNRFPEYTGTESVPEQFRVQVRRREKRRFGVHIVQRCAECVGRDSALSEESNRARQDTSRVRYSECGNIHDTGTYILDETKSGMHEE